MKKNAQKQTGPRARSGGFTLAELVVVLSIIAVLSMMVSPVFRAAFRDIRTESAINDLVATLAHAQTRAVSDSTEFRVYLDTERGTYWTERQTNPGERPAQFERVSDRFGTEAEFPDTLALKKVSARRDAESKWYFIAFYPHGAADLATVELVRTEEGGERYIVSTRGGRVTVKLS